MQRTQQIITAIIKLLLPGPHFSPPARKAGWITSMSKPTVTWSDFFGHNLGEKESNGKTCAPIRGKRSDISQEGDSKGQVEGLIPLSGSSCLS